MRLLSLTVEHFRCVRKASLDFVPGLNILFGPNDLGKSSLVRAMRAALRHAVQIDTRIDLVAAARQPRFLAPAERRQ